MEIVFHVGSPFRRRTLGRDDAATQHRTAVVGQIDRALVLEATGRIGLIGARLRPEGAAALLGHDVGQLAGTSAALDALWECDAAEVEERVYAATDVFDALGALESALLRRVERARAPHEGLVRAVRLAETTAGATSVRSLAAAAGTSTRQLERRFATDVGLSPKRFLRVLRVHGAARLLGEGTSPVETALRCGYFDESHLHRDFRLVTGGPPGRWISAEHGFADRLLG